MVDTTSAAVAEEQCRHRLGMPKEPGVELHFWLRRQEDVLRLQVQAGRGHHPAGCGAVEETVDQPSGYASTLRANGVVPARAVFSLSTNVAVEPRETAIHPATLAFGDSTATGRTLGYLRGVWASFDEFTFCFGL